MKLYSAITLFTSLLAVTSALPIDSVSESHSSSVSSSHGSNGGRLSSMWAQHKAGDAKEKAIDDQIKELKKQHKLRLKELKKQKEAADDEKDRAVWKTLVHGAGATKRDITEPVLLKRGGPILNEGLAAESSASVAMAKPGMFKNLSSKFSGLRAKLPSWETIKGKFIPNKGPVQWAKEKWAARKATQAEKARIAKVAGSDKQNAKATKTFDENNKRIESQKAAIAKQQAALDKQTNKLKVMQEKHANEPFKPVQGTVIGNLKEGAANTIAKVQKGASETFNNVKSKFPQRGSNKVQPEIIRPEVIAEPIGPIVREGPKLKAD